MNLQAEKIKLIEWLIGVKDVAILEKVENVRASCLEKVEEINSENISIEELKKRALASEKAIENGDVTSLNELKEEMKSW